MRVKDLWLALLALALALAALPAQSSSLQGLPNLSAEYPRTSMHDFVLGPVCLSLVSGPLDLDCNPAFLSSQEKRQFRISIVANNHLKQVNDHRERLNSNDTVGIVNSVLNQGEPTVARASTAIWYQREWWALGVSPFRGGFASSSRNPAYPELAAHVYKETEVFGKVGLVHGEEKDLNVGFQLRYVQRQFFKREFDLLDAVGNPSMLKIENQRALYLEPGVSYTFDSSWSSAVSATLTQLPLAQDGDGVEFKPVVDFGFSTRPPFLARRLRTSTHYTGAHDVNDVLSRFRWGAIYDFNDVASISALLGKTEIGAGLNGHFDSVVLGLGWKTEEIAPDRWQTVRVSTVLFEAGLVF